MRSSDSFYFLIETHSLPNAHSLLPSQLCLLCCFSRSLHSYFLIATSFDAFHLRASRPAGYLVNRPAAAIALNTAGLNVIESRAPATIRFKPSAGSRPGIRCTLFAESPLRSHIASTDRSGPRGGRLHCGFWMVADSVWPARQPKRRWADCSVAGGYRRNPVRNRLHFAGGFQQERDLEKLDAPASPGSQK